MAGVFKTSIEGGLARITLARPEAGNAVSMEFVDELLMICDRIEGDPGVRAVLIDSEGKNFCVGGDINSFVANEDPGLFIQTLADRLHEGIERLVALRAPVIVAVRGAAAGAGLGFAAAGDIVIAAESAFFTLAYTGIGLTADGGATWLLPRLIGLRRTQEMAFLNRRLSAPEAQEWGLITRAVPDDALEAEAMEIATRLAQGPTLAFGALKRLLRESHVVDLHEQLNAEAKSMAAALGTRDARGAVSAFLAREKPVFRGE